MGGLIALLVDRITMPAYDVVRELVTNEKDAKAKRVLINWNAAKKTLTVEGWGHGIQDLNKFMEILTDAKRLQKLVDPNVKISGEMGIGRLSALRLADKVVFESNNKDTKSLKITFDRREMETEIDPDVKQDTERRNAYLDHPGVKVTLVGVKREHHEDLAKAEKELSKIYAWSIITKQFDIVWNDQTLKPPADIQKLFSENDYKITKFETTQKFQLQPQYNHN